MKSKSILRFIMLTAISGALVFTSCKKKNTTPVETPAPDVDQTSALDNAYAEGTNNDIGDIGSQASENGSLSTFKTSSGSTVGSLLMAPCASVTAANKVITVDFGSGCLCKDGRLRSGKLLFDFSAATIGATAYRNPGFSLSISSVNYVVDGFTVNIVNKTIKNTTPVSIPSGPNPGANLTWSISANVSIIKPFGGGTINWVCNRTKALLNTNNPACYKGQALPIDWTIAKIQVDGTASGTTAQGDSYTATATAMVKDFTCAPDATKPNKHPFISGTMDFKPANKLVRTINYGGGSCDLDATLTVNNITTAFTLK